MAAKLKLYIYTDGTPPYSNDPSLKESIYYDSVFHPDNLSSDFIVTDKPEEADFFTCSYKFSDIYMNSPSHEISRQIVLEKIANLKYINEPEYQARHFFITGHCLFPGKELFPCRVFVTSLNRFTKMEHEYAIPLYSDDYSNIVDENPFYDFGFIGSVSHPVREQMLKYAGQYGTSRLQRIEKFYWELSSEDKDFFRKEFLEVSSGARFILCPRGFGESSFRFFEAMSMGRVPILISDSVALPFEDILDYNEFSFTIGEAKSDLKQLAEIAAIGESQYRQMARKGRQVWEDYFQKKVLCSQIARVLVKSPSLKDNFKEIKAPPKINIEEKKKVLKTVECKTSEKDHLKRFWASLSQKKLSKVALYGAGKFTKRLLSILSSTDSGPKIIAIIDDNATPGQSLGGHRVVRPDNTCLKGVTSFIPATDSIEEIISEKIMQRFNCKPILISDFKEDMGNG